MISSRSDVIVNAPTAKSVSCVRNRPIFLLNQLPINFSSFCTQVILCTNFDNFFTFVHHIKKIERDDILLACNYFVQLREFDEPKVLKILQNTLRIFMYKEKNLFLWNYFTRNGIINTCFFS